MRNGWTPERRARQAELIRTWRPWEQSTGPLTVDGKARTARNGDKGGAWRIERNMLRELGPGAQGAAASAGRMRHRMTHVAGHSAG